jgi:hemerythrin superfamily protein
LTTRRDAAPGQDHEEHRMPSTSSTSPASGSSNSGTDPVQLLTEDHRRVEQLFGQFQQSRDPDQKMQIAEKVFEELRVHGKLEKEIFYPAMREVGDQEDKELVEHSYHDHEESELLMAKMRGMTQVDQQYETLFEELISAVMEHAQEEELQMFPDAEKQMDRNRLDELGQQMESAKQQLQSGIAR